MVRTALGRSRRRLLRGSLVLVGLTLSAGCGGLPFLAKAQQKVPTLGYVGLGDPPATGRNPNYDAFVAGLRELGWVDGQTLTIQGRFAEGRTDRMTDLVGELIGLPLDLFVASGASGAVVAAKLTSTLPIVFASAADPVEQGLVCSLARPCANVTGLSNLAEGLDGKRVELLKEAIPGLTRLAILWHQPPMLSEFRRTQAATQANGIQLFSMDVADPDGIPAAFQAAMSNGAQGLVTISNGLTVSARARIVELAARYRLPTMFQTREFVEAGGLMSYGPSSLDQHRRAATYADKILRGARPADLPVEQPTTFDFVINLKSAQELGLSLPRSLLAQATEVIK